MNDQEKSKEIIQHYICSEKKVETYRILPGNEHRENENREQIIERYKERR